MSRVVIDSGVVSEAGTEPLAPPPSGIRGAPIAPPTPVADDDTVRVDLLLPMSGPNAKLGEAMLNAAQLALFDFADNNFELALHDTAGDPFFATEAAQKAVSEGASLIIGPLLGRSVRAIRSIVRSKGVPMIAFSSDGAVAGNGIYTMGFLPEAEVERVTDYAIDRGLRRFAVMAPDSDYGRAVVEAFAVSLEIAGGELIRTLYYDPFADDYATVVRDIADYDFRHRALLDKRMELRAREDGLAKEILRKLKNLQTIGDLPYDALLVADGGERLANIAALLPFYDVDPARCGCSAPTPGRSRPGRGTGLARRLARRAIGRAAIGTAIFEAYGVKPPRLATLAYDAPPCRGSRPLRRRSGFFHRRHHAARGLCRKRWNLPFPFPWRRPAGSCGFKRRTAQPPRPFQSPQDLRGQPNFRKKVIEPKGPKLIGRECRSI